MREYYKEYFIQFIKNNELIEKGDKVVIGLSGGPDSVCLLNLLCSIRDEFKIEVAAAHINHMIRGQEADKDERYCLEICERLQVKCFVKRINIKAIAKDKKISEEACGREERYNYFNEVKDKLNYNKIATAHNANDQAETIIMRIMRGTGLEGLGGIPIKRDGIYIRPILFMKRNEVEEYCKEIGENPHIDATNLEKIYSRNKVRLDILPYMKENFNEDIIETINRMGSILQRDNSFIEENTNKEYKQYVNQLKNEIVINKGVFSLHKALVSRIIRKALANFSGNKYNIEMKHINEIENLWELGTNKKIDLPNNLYAINFYGSIHIRVKEEIEECYNKKMTISKEEIINTNLLEFNDIIMELKIINSKNCINYDENALTKYFNYDNISGGMIVRYRKEGDKMIPLGMTGSKKLKDIFINMKIPQEMRDYIPIIEFDGEIAWAVGVKISDKFKVTKDTEQLLRISVKRKEIKNAK
ncbi:MAG: tRNA lysidine(34) synthetase TilS [Clostridiales bacterium]|nr:tRNA lysidine(34) synthetase TilS [Clostridiales bacterium]